MNRVLLSTTALLVRARNHARGIDRYPDPLGYFGPGGLDEAEALCAEAGRDLPAFVRPPATVEARAIERVPDRPRRQGRRIESWSFDSPLPSGSPRNDRVRLRVHLPPRHDGRAVVFHHPIYQSDWSPWTWLLADLIATAPVAMVAAPHHFERTEPGRFPGELTVNPNPARLYEAIRQWSWDHAAAVRALRDAAGLEVSGVIGFSFGAFQSLLLAAAGGIDVPLVALASTNRYAWGLTRGVLGKGLLRAMRRAGIDGERLARMTEALELERHVAPLRGRPVLSIRGRYDPVDPPPSLERLEEALAPTQALVLPAGHGTLLFHRARIVRETLRFLRDTGALGEGRGTRSIIDPARGAS